jgi:hypothetical protein
VVEVADRADVVKPFVLDDGEAGGVIPAIFEPLEAVNEKILGGPRADVSDDSAHSRPP